MTPRQFVLILVVVLGLLFGWSALLLFSGEPAAVATAFVGNAMGGLAVVSLITLAFFVRRDDE